MPVRAGSADLPLHGGRVPHWLAVRMAELGRVVTEAIVHHYGTDAYLRRLAHPFWFQSFGAVMGMDWHSSGITTSVIGALRRGLAPVADELGIYVCGGRGRYSRRTPEQLMALSNHTGLDGASLAATSRMVAKVDSAAVIDGYSLYLHAFVVSRTGAWTVVQQGMSPQCKTARRYHWHSERAGTLVDAPHAGIEGPPGGAITNLTDARSANARHVLPALVNEGPSAVVRAFQEARLSARPASLPVHLSMPARHAVRAADIQLPRLHANLAAAAELGPETFPELLSTPGVGARTMEALALVAEVVHGAPARFSDPARFAFAHGGKDGHPFPVPLLVFDETLNVLTRAVERAKLGRVDRLFALKRLSRLARTLEANAESPDWQTLVAAEWMATSHQGGRMVATRASSPASPRAPQLDLFPTPDTPLPKAPRAVEGKTPSWRND